MNYPKSSTVQKLETANEQTWLRFGSIAENMYQETKAISCYESALRHNPHSIPALTRIGLLYKTKEQFKKAIDYFKRIVIIQENSGDTWAALGHCYLMTGELQDSYQSYQQALFHLSDPNDPNLWYGIGILYDRYGSLTQAEEAFSSVLRMDPHFDKATEVTFRLGIIHKQQQQLDTSLQCFESILETPPTPLTKSDIRFQIGHVYEQMKKFDQAKEIYDHILSDNPEHAKVLQQLGWLHFQPDTPFFSREKATDYLSKSLTSNSSDAQTWYLMGRCYMTEKNYTKAYEAFQQAVYRESRNPTFWCSIGILYYKINQYEDALDAYSRAIRLVPSINEVWYNLGVLYESGGNNQKSDALDSYQRALELDPNDAKSKERIDMLKRRTSHHSTPPPAPKEIIDPSRYANHGSISILPFNHSANDTNSGEQLPVLTQQPTPKEPVTPTPTEM